MVFDFTKFVVVCVSFWVFQCSGFSLVFRCCSLDFARRSWMFGIFRFPPFGLVTVRWIVICYSFFYFWDSSLVFFVVV
jgi:hypothetical protein